MRLPIFHTDNKELHLMQTSWASAINPVLNAPISNGILLKNVKLTTGANSVSHQLGRKLQGWSIVRIRSASSIYDTQDSSTTPQLTLSLVSSAPAVVDIYVF